VIVARAVAPLDRLLPMALPLLAPGGTLIALKGGDADAEVARATTILRKWATERVEVGTVSYRAAQATAVTITLAVEEVRA
jgi:16S rRNA (guanine527-N7)-methyltransferase